MPSNFLKNNSSKRETFYERNKKKSLLLLLLLLLGGHKKKAALVLVLLLMLAFVGPTRGRPMFFAALGKIPFIGHTMSKAAERMLALHDESLGTDRFGALSAAWKAAREKGSSSWNVFSHGNSQTEKGGPLPNDSVSMVRGSKSEFFGTQRGANASGVSGILTREDGSKRGGGVEVDEGTMRGDRADYVEATMGGMFAGEAGAAGFAAGAGKVGTTAAFLAGASPYTQRGAFSGQNPVANKADNITTALAGSKIPKAAPVNTGPLSKRIAARGAVGTNAATNHQPIRGNMLWRSLAQLGDGRAYSMMARDPLCTAMGGCPPEYASLYNGVVYDGFRAKDTPNVIMAGSDAPSVDGISVPNVNTPDDSNLDRYIAETNTISDDAQKCREADDYYTPLENNAMNDYLAKRQAACDVRGPQGQPCQRDSSDSASFNGQSTSWYNTGTSQKASFLSCLFSLGRGCVNYSPPSFALATFYAECRDKVAQVEVSCSNIDMLRLQHYQACPIMMKDTANPYETRCDKPKEAGGYDIPSCP